MPSETKPASVVVPPRWRFNYNLGYIGFISPATENDVLSIGITYFEQWDKLGDIDVVHALVVTGPNSCVEALMGKGVCSNPLDHYFNDPNANIFFRKPVDYNEDLGKRIATIAAPEVGKQYDDLLIAAFALRGSFFGRFVTNLFGNAPTTSLNEFMHHNGKWICSELAAHCLEEQPELVGKGVLATPDFAINPQMLFEDESDIDGGHVFEPWHTGEAPLHLTGSDPVGKTQFDPSLNSTENANRQVNNSGSEVKTSRRLGKRQFQHLVN